MARGISKAWSTCCIVLATPFPEGPTSESDLADRIYHRGKRDRPPMSGSAAKAASDLDPTGSTWQDTAHLGRRDPPSFQSVSQQVGPLLANRYQEATRCLSVGQDQLLGHGEPSPIDVRRHEGVVLPRAGGDHSSFRELQRPRQKGHGSR